MSHLNLNRNPPVASKVGRVRTPCATPDRHRAARSRRRVRRTSHRKPGSSCLPCAPSGDTTTPTSSPMSQFRLSDSWSVEVQLRLAVRVAVAVGVAVIASETRSLTSSRRSRDHQTETPTNISADLVGSHGRPPDTTETEVALDGSRPDSARLPSWAAPGVMGSSPVLRLHIAPSYTPSARVWPAGVDPVVLQQCLDGQRCCQDRA
jgi:hypothetical protein